MYSSFRKFIIENIKSTLKNKLKSLSSYSYSEIEKVFLNELKRHAPLKRKILRHNNNALTAKELRKEIMTRLKLKSKFYEERSHINWYNFKRQRNHYLKTLQKTKKEYFDHLN